MKQNRILLGKTRNMKKKSYGEEFAEWAVAKFAPKYHMRLKPKKGLKRKKKLNPILEPLTMEERNEKNTER